jgi:hypothetical protein
MKKSFFLLMAVLVLGLGLTSAALASCTDTITNPTGFFASDPTTYYSAPYYRWNGENWDWTHNGVCSAGVQSATLTIKAFDVDSISGEVDKIYGWDTTSSNYMLLGSLTGVTDAVSNTTFTLPSSLYDEVQSGLKVFIEIDTDNQNFAVTLLSSTLEAQCVPLPGTLMLLSSGLLGLAGWRRFRKG